MTNLNSENLSQKSSPSSMKSVKILRTNQALNVGGLLVTSGAFGVFLLTQYTIPAVLLGLAGLALFGVRQLVKKSLALTASDAQLQSTSIDKQLENLRKQVSKCKFLQYVEADGTKAADQANELLEQYKSLKNILSQKFEVTEMTYSRYLGGVDASCLSIGETLAHIKSILENLSLTGKNQTDQWKQKLSQVVNLLKSNDDALQGLATLFHSLNEVMTKEKHRDQLDQNMLRLKELADRAKLYSKP